MAEVIRAGLVQQQWTGDKDSMIRASVDAIGRAASAGAQVVCLQELFYGPYFCQVQDADYYSYTEAVPDGPTTRLLQDEHGLSISVIIGQVRSTAIDLLRGSGMTGDEARTALDAAVERAGAAP